MSKFSRILLEEDDDHTNDVVVDDDDDHHDPVELFQKRGKWWELIVELLQLMYFLYIVKVRMFFIYSKLKD